MKRSWLALGAASLFAGAIAAACSSEEAPQLREVALGASEYAFTAPENVAGGIVRVKLSNTGKEAHHGQLVRLNDGVTMPQFQQKLQTAGQANFEGPAAGELFSIISFDGGPGPTVSAKSTETVVTLKQGQYVLLCFLPDPQGVPHLAKGMLKPMTVTAATETQPAAPKVTASIETHDFVFTNPPTGLKAGKQSWAVTNKGKEVHEMGLIKLKAPADQVRQALTAPPSTTPPSGPPPFEDVGGLQAIQPGMTAWPSVELEKGDYALVCFIPSGANQGKPHVALGMFNAFTVK